VGRRRAKRRSWPSAFSERPVGTFVRVRVTRDVENDARDGRSHRECNGAIGIRRVVVASVAIGVCWVVSVVGLVL
jgi:hypothetical protein